MQLEELRSLVLGADVPEWHWVQDGPHYRDRFVDLSTTLEDGSGHYAVGTDAHRSLLVLLADVDVSIAWGMPMHWNGSGRDLSRGGWSQRLDVKRPPVAMYADVFFRGALVDRGVLCAVDSHLYGKVCLPYPSAMRIADELRPIDDGKRYAYTASNWDLRLARLVHALDFSGDFDPCLRRSGIRSENEQDDAFLTD